DLDHFKAVNDRFGHAVGDEALECMVHTLRATVRRQDHVGRYGGGGRLVGFPAGQAEGARGGIAPARIALGRAQLPAAGAYVPLNFSAGVVAAAEGEALGALLSRADAALYEAKSSGRNRVVSA